MFPALLGCPTLRRDITPLRAIRRQNASPSTRERSTPSTNTTLSCDEIRRILGSPDLSDEQTLAIREDLYAWLNRALDEYFASTGAVHSG